MFDSKRLLAGILAAATVGLAHGATLTTVGTTGVFDESTNSTNSVDLDPTGNLAAFKASVASAYANNQGGVIDWEAGVPVANTGNSTTAAHDINPAVAVAFGVGASETLTITFDDRMAIYTNNVVDQVSGISTGSVAGTSNAILPFDLDASARSFVMTFSDADVAEVGLGMLARTTFGSGINYRATATFSDASTTNIDYTIDGVFADGAGGTDTFLHFEAATGQTITSVAILYQGDVGGEGAPTAEPQRRPVLDDFGFIVVPEPSSLALLGLGGLCILRRRRQG